MLLNPKIGPNNYNCKRLNVISKQIEAILLSRYTGIQERGDEDSDKRGI